MNKQYVVCTDGILSRKGKMLFLKRNVEPFKGFWHVPGGQVEKNESLEQSLKREFKEETNLDIEVGPVFFARFEETTDRLKVIVAFEVISAKGDIVLNSESQEYRWFDKTPEKSVFDYFQVKK